MISFETLLIVLVIVAVAYFFFRGSRVSLKKPEKGTVYFVRASYKSWFHKVGYTVRPFVERKSELERNYNGGKRVFEVALIDNMPFAWDVEQWAHKRLNKTRYHLKGRRDNVNTRDKGKEFYVLKHQQDVEFFLDTLQTAVSDVRRVAITRGRWPSDADQFVKITVWLDGRRQPPVFPFRKEIKDAT
ncbi:GIY-YIG nuclease family protein [Roseibium aggregatum]|uniref:Bacteriophage T5 Orf172 DNA-binding domain-containing protein n=1 Tax=Roseibium aggregatum TaxID=187304 RepID=A0A0M6YDK1_9HYPH|nr:GIY-YIG nuclease family protein [Roseibium aggregatum]CTQ47317.1 hypothetical protein LAL4801_05779 [Roseibium aggregatum]